jgi:hypothetical protein
MEFAYIPDEAYFGMIAASQEFNISDMIISRNVHLVNFVPGESHPKTFHDGDQEFIFENAKYFFARKIDASVDKKLKAVLDEFRNNNPYYEVGFNLSSPFNKYK